MKSSINKTVVPCRLVESVFNKEENFDKSNTTTSATVTKEKRRRTNVRGETRWKLLYFWKRWMKGRRSIWGRKEEMPLHLSLYSCSTTSLSQFPLSRSITLYPSFYRWEKREMFVLTTDGGSVYPRRPGNATRPFP